MAQFWKSSQIVYLVLHCESLFSNFKQKVNAQKIEHPQITGTMSGTAFQERLTYRSPKTAMSTGTLSNVTPLKHIA